MLTVVERRRHPRTEMVCPATLRDKTGRIVFRGRSVDVSPCGIKVIGPPPAAVYEGLEVWVELTVPSVRSSGPRIRIVKIHGEVRRVTDIGGWKSVIVVVLENDFSTDLLTPLP